jgi:uncharacterized membrane protein
MARSYRLDTPRETRRSLRGNIDPETFGRLSERFARALGTARFLVYMSAFVFSWVLWNTFGPEGLRYDEFPFIFLTLILSLQASYAAPLILLAQNRQAEVATRDYLRNELDDIAKEIVEELRKPESDSK